jgi:hypothetical protein
MDSSLAVLLGAFVGAASGLAGPSIATVLQERRDRVKWFLENRKTAYLESLRNLSRAMNFRTELTTSGAAIKEEDAKDLFAALGDAQGSLAILTAFCSAGERENIIRVLDEFSAFVRSIREFKAVKGPTMPASPDLDSLYQSIVESARRDMASP